MKKQKKKKKKKIKEYALVAKICTWKKKNKIRVNYYLAKTLQLLLIAYDLL